MNKVVVYLILLIVVLSIAIFFLVADPFNTGDFTYTLHNGTSKYEKNIKEGISYWANLNVEGMHLVFRTSTVTEGSNVLARNVGNTIFINTPVFDSVQDRLKSLTVAHEVGHALGIGKWSQSSVLTSAGGQIYLSPSVYPKTAKSYIEHYRPDGVTLPGPPIENAGGAGTARVHWEDNPAFGMQRSSMVGTISSNASLITFVDLAFLEEIGRKVDTNRGQKFSLYVMLKEFLFDEVRHDCGCTNPNHKH